MSGPQIAQMNTDERLAYLYLCSWAKRAEAWGGAQALPEVALGGFRGSVRAPSRTRVGSIRKCRSSHVCSMACSWPTDDAFSRSGALGASDETAGKPRAGVDSFEAERKGSIEAKRPAVAPPRGGEEERGG